MIDELMDALEEWQSAKAALKACEDDCEYDADYFCSRQAADERAARAKVESALAAIIDARIAASKEPPK